MCRDHFAVILMGAQAVTRQSRVEGTNMCLVIVSHRIRFIRHRNIGKSLSRCCRDGLEESVDEFAQHYSALCRPWIRPKTLEGLESNIHLRQNISQGWIVVAIENVTVAHRFGDCRFRPLVRANVSI